MNTLGKDIMAEINVDDMKKERRKFVRHTCKVYIEMIIRCSDGFSGTASTNRIEVKGKMLDLSLEGCKIFTRDGFTEGQELRLIIVMPDQPKVATGGIVRWSRAMEKPAGFASGVRFRNLSESSFKIIRGYLKPYLAAETEAAD
jgi:c-di-GMP-binding flagellar brake protein YcgR